MKYYKHTVSGSVYSYETEQERAEFGPLELVPMTQAEIDAHLTPPPPPTPNVVTMRQARLALLGAGLLDSVGAAIAAIPDTAQRQAVEIEWEYAHTVDRASPFTQQLASGLGLTSEQLDSLFTQAAAL